MRACKIQGSVVILAVLEEEDGKPIGACTILAHNGEIQLHRSDCVHQKPIEVIISVEKR